MDKLCLDISKGDAVIIPCSDEEEEDQRGAFGGEARVGVL